MEDKSSKKTSLFDLENKLKFAKNIHDLNEVIKQHLANSSISTFAFTYYSYYPNALNKIIYDFASQNYQVWHEHYLKEHYEEIDSTLDKVYRTTLPTYWDLKLQLKEASTLKEKKMRLDSVEFGTEKGLSIPIHGPHEDFAIFLIIQMRGENCLEDWQTQQYDLLATGYLYYFYLQQHLLKVQEPAKKLELNHRELQCLTLIAKQYPMSTIAKKLNITVRTVNYHIQRLNKKLGTKNKYQSAAKALRDGLIKL